MKSYFNNFSDDYFTTFKKTSNNYARHFDLSNKNLSLKKTLIDNDRALDNISAILFNMLSSKPDNIFVLNKEDIIFLLRFVNKELDIIDFF